MNFHGYKGWYSNRVLKVLARNSRLEPPFYDVCDSTSSPSHIFSAVAINEPAYMLASDYAQRCRDRTYESRDQSAPHLADIFRHQPDRGAHLSRDADT